MAMKLDQTLMGMTNASANSLQEMRDLLKEMRDFAEVASKAKTGATFPNKKIPPLSTISADAWYAWRSTFCIMKEIAGWSNSRARMEIAAAMQGDAKVLTSEVKTEHEFHGGR